MIAMHRTLLAYTGFTSMAMLYERASCMSLLASFVRPPTTLYSCVVLNWSQSLNDKANWRQFLTSALIKNTQEKTNCCYVLNTVSFGIATASYRWIICIGHLTWHYSTIIIVHQIIRRMWNERSILPNTNVLRELQVMWQNMMVMNLVPAQPWKRILCHRLWWKGPDRASPCIGHKNSSGNYWYRRLPGGMINSFVFPICFRFCKI